MLFEINIPVHAEYFPDTTSIVDDNIYPLTLTRLESNVIRVLKSP